jgi:hypothetical protein
VLVRAAHGILAVFRQVWRVEALALPALMTLCARCACVTSFRCTERFRVNANGALLDVWLLYRCAKCAALHKQRVRRRVRVDALPHALLDAYQRDARSEVRRCAFAVSNAEVPYRVVREPLPASGELRVRIQQPEPCGARWDRLLARELGWSRARVTREASAGRVSVNGAAQLRSSVRDGDEAAVAFA